MKPSAKIADMEVGVIVSITSISYYFIGVVATPIEH
jgi:hypothetical protein